MRTKGSTKKNLTDQAAELVEQVSPHVEAVKERIVNDYVPVAQSLLAEAREVAQQVAQDARDAAQEAAANAEKSTRKSRKRAARKARAKAGQMAAAAAAAAPMTAPLAERVQAKVEPKPRRKKRFLLFLGLVGAGAFVFKKLRSEAPSTPAYAPPRPAPRPTPVPDAPASSTPPAPPAQHFEPDPDAPADPAADAIVDAGPGAQPADRGGAFFDEALADASEEPHKVTTPDHPADVEDVSGVPDPKST